MSNWQTVYSSPNPHQAEIVKDVLNNAGIAAIVFNNQDRAYRLGRLEVRVSPDSVMRAMKFIEEEIKFTDE